jgi:hypothetical protein
MPWNRNHVPPEDYTKNGNGRPILLNKNRITSIGGQSNLDVTAPSNFSCSNDTTAAVACTNWRGGQEGGAAQVRMTMIESKTFKDEGNETDKWVKSNKKQLPKLPRNKNIKSVSNFEHPADNMEDCLDELHSIDQNGLFYKIPAAVCCLMCFAWCC